MDKKCTFCKIGEEGLLKKLPLKFDGGKSIDCERGIYKDEYCIATLTPEQYTKGHTIVVLKNHRTDITDNDISDEELCGFIKAIHKISKHLKNKLGAERIYVCILCDGEEHLHVHLIPRYLDNKTGFQFMGELEKDSQNNDIEFNKKSTEEKDKISKRAAEELQRLAEALRISLI